MPPARSAATPFRAANSRAERVRASAFAASAMLGLTIAPAAWAQTDTDPQEMPEPIIVTGRGLPDTPATPAYGTREIARDSIVSSASGRIEDVLGNVAGFQQFRRSDSRSANPSAQGVTLRALGGNAASRALVLLDGVPMADPFFGYIPFSAIAPERLASVRVTRGGGSGAFGAGAVAGTIELASAGPGTLGLVNGGLLVNGRGESEVSATVAPRLGEGFVVASGRWDRGRGFFTTPADQRVDQTARARFDSWSASLRAVAPVSDTIELQASALAYRDDRTLRFTGADSASRAQDASLRMVGRGDWAFDALAYVQARNFRNVVVSSTRFVPVLDQRDTPSLGLGGKLEIRPPVGAGHALRLGTDVRIADGNLREDAISAFTGQRTERRSAGGRNSDLGIYAEDDWTLGALVLTAGVRADRWTVRDGFYRAVDSANTTVENRRFGQRSGWDTTFRAGALFDAGSGVKLRAAAYSGIRLPTLNELYRPFVVFPVVTQANPDLRNERLVGYEAGIDYTPGAWGRIALTAFDNRVRHAIANVTLSENLRQRRNLDAVHARGLEADAALRMGAFSLTGSLSLTDAEVEGEGDSAPLDGLTPPQVPDVAASATLAWEPGPGWRLSATMRHVGRQFEDDLETDVLPAATTFDAYAQVPLSDAISFVLRAENLGDTRVVTRNQAGSIDLGAPRTVWAGIRIGMTR